MTGQASCNLAGCRCGTTTSPIHQRVGWAKIGYADDRLTGYATENVVPATPEEIDGVREMLPGAFLVRGLLKAEAN